MHPLSQAKSWAVKQKRFVPARLWQYLRSFWFLVAPVFWRKKQVKHRYAGHEFTIWITDPISAEWYDSDWDEPPEFQMLRTLASSRGIGGLRPGATVFNLGAHQSVIAMMLAAKIGPDGKVIALEANKRNAQIGRRNVETNGLTSRVNVIWSAAGPRDGDIEFNNGFNGQIISNKTLTSGIVPMRSVDSLALEHGKPDVVFIDVEGFEGEVLEGATRTLTKNRTDYFVEVHAIEDLSKFKTTAANILSIFPAQTFDCYALDPFSDTEKAFRPILDCDNIIKSGKRFYLLATWKND